MAICHTPGCPASKTLDEFGRRPSVMHASITQPVLGATGHHLLNRQIDGTLDEHLAAWTFAERLRAQSEVFAEIERAKAYVAALVKTEVALLLAER